MDLLLGVLWYLSVKTVSMPLYVCSATYENSLEDDEFVTSGFLEYNFHLVPDCFPVDVNSVAAWGSAEKVNSLLPIKLFFFFPPSLPCMYQCSSGGEAIAEPPQCARGS